MNSVKAPIVASVVTVFVMLICGIFSASTAQSHEIPNDVVVQSILKQDGRSVDFLVRVPLEAMRDVNFPENGPGYLVISQADQTINDAAVIWIAREVGIYENLSLIHI